MYGTLTCFFRTCGVLPLSVYAPCPVPVSLRLLLPACARVHVPRLQTVKWRMMAEDLGSVTWQQCLDFMLQLISLHVDKPLPPQAGEDPNLGCRRSRSMTTMTITMTVMWRLHSLLEPDIRVFAARGAASCL